MKAYLGLNCKPGNFGEVFKKLLFKLYIDPQDIYLLKSPVDILIQFNKLENLEEFITEWFNPVRTIGVEEDLIDKIQSYIVISPSSPFPSEKPYAFVFINTQTKSSENVRIKLLAIPEVLSADSVLGPYTLISSLKANNNAECERVVSTIQHIPEVEYSTASLVDATDLFPEW